jgi:zinc-ribbon domain
MPQCANCQTENREDSLFCRQCGQSLVTVPGSSFPATDHAPGKTRGPDVRRGVYIDIATAYFAVIGIGFGIGLSIVGSFLPWFEESADRNTQTLDGLDHHGVWITVVAVAVAISVLGLLLDTRSNRWLLAVALLGGTMIIATSANDWVQYERLFEGAFDPREGLYLVLIGGVVIVLASIATFFAAGQEARASK